MKSIVETYHFTNLLELRDFLNGFKSTDLSTVLPDDADCFKLQWIEETLSDGSKVNNAIIALVMSLGE